LDPEHVAPNGQAAAAPIRRRFSLAGACTECAFFGETVSMIEFENVSRRYGAKVAVSDLNLQIPSGQLFAFLGPNGAGKTTTIKMIVGLLRPSTGTIRLCGHDVTADNSAANRLLGYVPDVPYLYDKLTGVEFLQFIADMYGLDPSETAGKIAQQIDFFQLHDFVEDLTESYSHGMKQRLAFAAAMLHKPRVLVIDEPMVGLDPRSVRMVKDLLRRNAAEGQTIFMSTHLLAIAEEIADRVGIVDQGRLKFLGTIDELRQKLATRETSLEHLYLNFTAAERQAAESLVETERPAANGHAAVDSPGAAASEEAS
jgi:ABC-2 type transport system ATP-binding protein